MITSTVDEFQANQAELLKKFADNQAASIELQQKQQAIHEQELLQKAEETRALLIKAQAEAETAKQLDIANKLQKKQTELLEKLLAEVTTVVLFFNSGKLESEIDGFREIITRLVYVNEAMILNRPHDELTNILLAIVRGEVPSSVVVGKKRSNSATLSIYEIALTSALLQCHTIQNSFDSLRNDLPIDIGSRIVDKDNRFVQVRELVRACVQMNSVPQLVDILRQYEGNSIAFGEVVRVVNSKN